MATLTASQLAICAAMFGLGMGTQSIIKPSGAPVAKKHSSRPVAKKPAIASKSNHSVAPAVPPAVAVEPYDLCIPPLNDYSVDLPQLLTTSIESNVVGSNVTAVEGDSSWGGRLSPPSPPGAVPEPSSWGMLIGGFGFVGLSLRRKRNVRA